MWTLLAPTLKKSVEKHCDPIFCRPRRRLPRNVRYQEHPVSRRIPVHEIFEPPRSRQDDIETFVRRGGFLPLYLLPCFLTTSRFNGIDGACVEWAVRPSVVIRAPAVLDLSSEMGKATCVFLRDDRPRGGKDNIQTPCEDFDVERLQWSTRMSPLIR